MVVAVRIANRMGPSDWKLASSAKFGKAPMQIRAHKV